MTNSTAYFFISILLFAVTSVSCAYTPTDSLNKDSQKYLSYYETVKGERIHWEVNFFGDEITSIYKNGNRIPDNLVDDYKHKVYEELDAMRFGGDHFSFRMPVIVGDEFNFDMEEFQKEMEEMRNNLPNLDEQFNSEEFKKEMEELKKELKENKSKIYKFKFHDEKFKEQMKELQKNLKENLIKPEDFNFHFEWEEDTEA
ncbi:MAG: hypothetical protein OQJ78_10705 [Ignavibacteriaceae bacterium]|jgi:cytochrome c556|nr:hypothetical protein [Ignavibacteriaceae bacterium]